MTGDPESWSVEDVSDPRAQQRTDEYFQALGRFIHNFAFVEAGLQSLVAHLAAMPDEISRAVLSDTRIDRGISLVRRLNEATDRSPDPILDDVFQQLRAINDKRNDIVHFGARIHEDPDREMIVTTERAAHIPDRARIFPVTAAMLHDMADDLLTISHCLDVAILRLVFSPESARETGLDDVSRAPWRYKRP